MDVSFRTLLSSTLGSAEYIMGETEASNVIPVLVSLGW